jgi:hypothetical protein
MMDGKRDDLVIWLEGLGTRGIVIRKIAVAVVVVVG